MKIINRFLFTALAVIASFALQGCEKDDETANVSFVTTYPVVTMAGEQWIAIPVGGTFTDPGATATVGESSTEVTVSGTVDTNVPGVYVITYTATNPENFSASATRYVGVIAPEAAAIDLSGQYRRTAGALGVSTVTRIAPGLYETDNVGGVAEPGPETTVRFFHYEGTTLAVPEQDVQGSTFSAEDATVIPGVSYSWSVINAGYGDVLRTFVKI